MLDEIIRELTAKDNNEQTMSKDVLVWVKRIKAQRAQAAILNDITESQKFNKVKLAQKPNGIWKQHTQHITSGHEGIVVAIMFPGSAQPMEKHAPDAGKWATSRRYAGVRGIMQCMKWNRRWCRNHKKK